MPSARHPDDGQSSPRLLEGKTGLVMGVASKRSIAWGIATSANREGARLALAYQSERLGDNLRELAPALRDPLLLQCDVASDEQIDALIGAPSRDGRPSGLPRACAGIRAARGPDGPLCSIPRARDFAVALDVSAYSLVKVARAALPLMQGRQASIVTLTYLGSERVAPGYNVMGVAKAALEASVRYLASELGPEGIRVNAISAGPIRTLASSAVPGVVSLIKHHAEHAPLRKAVDIDEVGDAALFLLSPWSRGITGEVIFVDGGYHILAV